MKECRDHLCSDFSAATVLLQERAPRPLLKKDRRKSPTTEGRQEQGTEGRRSEGRDGANTTLAEEGHTQTQKWPVT